MPLLNVVFVAMVCVLMSPLGVLAQSVQPSPAVSIPRLVNISGVFQPVDGQPPAPVEAVTLSIYSAPEGGALLWQETQVVPFDKSGRFTVLMGATQADGIPPEVFASGQAHWMSMQVARVGEVEQPRVRIASVPYALRASDAETLGGLPASAYLLAPTAGDSDPRAASASGVKAASGAAVESSGGTADLVLAGATDFLAKYVNSADVGNSAVYETGGNVGIGTTTPLDTLHLRFTNPGGTATGLSVQNLGNTATSYSGMLFYDQFGALGQFQGFNNVTHEYRINNIALNGTGQPNGSINFMLGGASKFLVASNGNIGIGTAVPFYKLEVEDPLNNGLRVVTQTVGGSVASFGSMGDFRIDAPFNSGGRFLVKESGKVGIGMPLFGTPAFQLHVLDPSNTGLRVETGTAGGTVASFGGVGDFQIDAPFFPAGRFVVKEDGLTGIGTETPGSRLDVNGIITVRTLGSAGATTLCRNASNQISTCSSSLRYKTNVTPFHAGLNLIDRLRPIAFDWKANGEADLGLAAEEVAEVEPLLVIHNDRGEVEGVKYDRINLLLINAVKEQQAQITRQQEEIDTLRRQQDDLVALTALVCADHRTAAVCKSN